MMPIPAEPSAAPEEARNAAFAECALGMWVFGKELVRGVEMLADATLPPIGWVEPLEEADPEPVSRLLR
jgi:hypothetical protein